MGLLGACTVTVRLDEYPVIARFQVAHITEETVLGTDVLEQYHS